MLSKWMCYVFYHTKKLRCFEKVCVCVNGGHQMKIILLIILIVCEQYEDYITDYVNCL